MGVVGVDLEKNKVYTYATDDALTKKAIMDSSNATYMMMENSKFSREGNYRYAYADDFTGVIVDEITDSEIINKIGQYNLRLYM